MQLNILGTGAGGPSPSLATSLLTDGIDALFWYPYWDYSGLKGSITFVGGKPVIGGRCVVFNLERNCVEARHRGQVRGTRLEMQVRVEARHRGQVRGTQHVTQVRVKASNGMRNERTVVIVMPSTTW